jgi:hypothetical protein
MKKKIFILLLGLIILSITIPFIINTGIGFIDEKFNGKAYVPLENWVGFLGGFLGAGFALIGIFWEINHINQNAIKEKTENTKMAYLLLEEHLNTLENKLEKVSNKLMERVKERDEDTIKFENYVFLEPEDFYRNFKKKEEFIYSFLKDSLFEEKNNILYLLISFEKILEDLIKISKPEKNDELSLITKQIIYDSLEESERIRASVSKISRPLNEIIFKISEIKNKIPDFYKTLVKF